MVLTRILPGARPLSSDDGALSPSRLGLRLATKPKTDFDGGTYASKRRGERDMILVICTEEGRMTMANGAVFDTGNHPVETFVPLMHLSAAGFGFRLFTPSGEPVKLEEWAFPRDDEAVMAFYAQHTSSFEKPESLANFVVDGMPDAERVAAVFVPGGHGAMLGLPNDPNVADVLSWAHESGRRTLALCHGPAALLALKDGPDFPYRGYEIAAFPDMMDRLTPSFGYLPGPMPWYFGAGLKSRGMTIVNRLASGTCHRDRDLITGDSPDAANSFGRLAAETLLEDDQLAES